MRLKLKWFLIKLILTIWGNDMFLLLVQCNNNYCNVLKNAYCIDSFIWYFTEFVNREIHEKSKNSNK